MKKNKGGFTLVDVLLILAIVTLAVVVLAFYNDYVRNYGRVAEKPTAGCIYFVTATDKGAKLVIAMPWKFQDDKAVITDRRILLKLSTTNACEAGVWFVRSKDGQINLIPPPVVKASSSPEVNE